MAKSKDCHITEIELKYLGALAQTIEAALDLLRGDAKHAPWMIDVIAAATSNIKYSVGYTEHGVELVSRLAVVEDRMADFATLVAQHRERLQGSRQPVPTRSQFIDIYCSASIAVRRLEEQA